MHGLRGVHALIVGGNDTRRDVLEEQLTAWGATCDMAADNELALTLLRLDGEAYGLIVIDGLCAHLDSIGLVGRINAGNGPVGAPILLINPMCERIPSEALREAAIRWTLLSPVRQRILYDTLVAMVKGERRDDAVDAPMPEGAPANAIC